MRLIAVLWLCLLASHATAPMTTALPRAGATKQLLQALASGTADGPTVTDLVLKLKADANGKDQHGTPALHLALAPLALRAAFDELDKDRSGTVGTSEMFPILKAATAAFATEADSVNGDDGGAADGSSGSLNKDGQVDFHEFERWARSGSPTSLRLRLELDEAPAAIAALVKAGAHVNAVDAKGHSALNVAADHGHLGAVEALVAAGATTGVHEDSALLLATGRQRPDIVLALKGAHGTPSKQEFGEVYKDPRCEFLKLSLLFILKSSCRR